MNLETYKYLFLDRDGVINVERPNDYVKSIEEMVFEQGALEAISVLSKRFERIFIVTNQRGVGCGKMTSKDLQDVHSYMLDKIKKTDGNIDKIYFCADIDSHSINRKPNMGMIFKAKADFPEVDFLKSIMVGNSKSDIHFGNKAGMFTVLVGDKYPEGDKIYDEADCFCDNLLKFALLTNTGKK